MYIYKITNKVNEKAYIGMSEGDPAESARWKEHVYIAKNHNGTSTYLYNAMRKYGLDGFLYEVIDISARNREELKQLEIKFIAELNTLKPNGYNMTIGGDGGNTLITLSEKELKRAKEKFSKSIAETNKKPEVKERQSNAAKRAWQHRFSVPGFREEHSKEQSKISKQWWSEKELTEEDRKIYSEAQKLRARNESSAQRKKRLDTLSLNKFPSKLWRLTFPTGRIEIIESIYIYCKKNELPYDKIYSSKRRGSPSKDGWFLELLDG